MAPLNLRLVSVPHDESKACRVCENISTLHLTEMNPDCCEGWLPSELLGVPILSLRALASDKHHHHCLFMMADTALKMNDCNWLMLIRSGCQVPKRQRDNTPDDFSCVGHHPCQSVHMGGPTPANESFHTDTRCKLQTGSDHPMRCHGCRHTFQLRKQLCTAKLFQFVKNLPLVQ